MSKHIVDEARERDTSARAGQFSKIDADDRPHLQSKALQRQATTRDPANRTKRFVTIERQAAKHPT